MLPFARGCPAIAGDIYEPLIGLWMEFQRAPHAVVQNYRLQWTALTDELETLMKAGICGGKGLPAYYYAVRDRFNASQDPLDLHFLTRTCVNGIIRFNKAGKFNNSFHLTRRGIHPNRLSKIVRDWHPFIDQTKFVAQDYRETLELALPGDLAYLDPPYMGTNQRYAATVVYDELYAELENLNRKGVYWMLSLDGHRGGVDYPGNIPESLYSVKLSIRNGHSSLHKVLNNQIEEVTESLYLNFNPEAR